jgi:hypothetical protein
MDLILGHNQFLGISHISEDKARDRERKFSDVKNIYHIVEAAHDLGYKGMVIETHPRMLEFLNYYKENRTFDLDFYLQVPYVQGYIQRANENGIGDLILGIINQTGVISAGSIAIRSLIDSVKSDYISMALNLLKLEVSPFSDIKIKALLLHNVMTDLLLSFQMEDDPIKRYFNYVKDELDMVPGFITLNFPLLKSRFERLSLSPSLVMTPINPKGYDMNPSQIEVEKAIKSFNGNIIAMNIFGGGAFSIIEVRDYINQLTNINCCVIGASSSEHLQNSFEAFSVSL